MEQILPQLLNLGFGSLLSPLDPLGLFTTEDDTDNFNARLEALGRKKKKKKKKKWKIKGKIGKLGIKKGKVGKLGIKMGKAVAGAALHHATGGMAPKKKYTKKKKKTSSSTSKFPKCPPGKTWTGRICERRRKAKPMSAKQKAKFRKKLAAEAARRRKVILGRIASMQSKSDNPKYTKV